jgi:riboflavin kinase/FMN adenylyltransferase
MQVYNGLNQLPQFKNTVLTIGTYDGVHIGHQAIIQRVNELAQEIGGQSLMLTFDPHPKFVLSNNHPDLKLISTIEEKIELLEKFGLDNLVITPFSKDFAAMEAEDYVQKILVEHFHPSIIVIGYYHRFGKNRKGDIELLKELGPKYNYKVEEISVQTIDEISVSSTKVRNALLEGNIVDANTWLAHHFIIQGKVIHGDKIGRTIGFTTANIQVNYHKKLIPPPGVYAVWAEVKGKRYQGALSISYRPTILENGELRVEVYLIDFDEDIYGEEVRLIFVDWIRGDLKFENLEQLIEQINSDVQQVKNVLNSKLS